MSYTPAFIRFGVDGASSPSWSGACGASVTNWDTGDQLVIAAWTIEGVDHTPATKAFTVRWRNKTDNPSGSFATFVTGSGELRAGASAGALVNTTTVNNSSGCATSTYSEEIENESPLQSASFSPAKNEYIEMQFCVDMSNALTGKEYEFELYDATLGASLGNYTYTVTIAAGLTPINGTPTDDYESVPSDSVSGNESFLGTSSDAYESLYADAASGVAGIAGLPVDSIESEFAEALNGLFKHNALPTDDYEPLYDDTVEGFFKYYASLVDDYDSLYNDTANESHPSTGATPLEKTATDDYSSLYDDIVNGILRCNGVGTDDYNSIPSDTASALQRQLGAPEDTYSVLTDAINGFLPYYASISDDYSGIITDTVVKELYGFVALIVDEVIKDLVDASESAISKVATDDYESLYADTVYGLYVHKAVCTDDYEAALLDSINALFKHYGVATDTVESILSDVASALLKQRGVISDAYNNLYNDTISALHKHLGLPISTYEFLISDIVYGQLNLLALPEDSSIADLFVELVTKALDAGTLPIEKLATDEYNDLYNDLVSALCVHKGIITDSYESILNDAASAIKRHRAQAEDAYGSLYNDTASSLFKLYGGITDSYSGTLTDDATALKKHLANIVDNYGTLFADEVFKSVPVVGTTPLEIYPTDDYEPLYADSLTGFFLYYVSISDTLSSILNDASSALNVLKTDAAEDNQGNEYDDNANIIQPFTLSATDDYNSLWLDNVIKNLIIVTATPIEKLIGEDYNTILNDTLLGQFRYLASIDDTLGALFTDNANASYFVTQHAIATLDYGLLNVMSISVNYAPLFKIHTNPKTSTTISINTVGPH